MLVRCPVRDVFYGGARGGGKTDGSLGTFALQAGRYGFRARGIIFRRTLVELEDVIDRSQEIYGDLGATYNIQQKIWTFPPLPGEKRGAVLRFRYLMRDADARLYQGKSATFLGFEELTNFPTPAPFDKLWGILRSPYVGPPWNLKCIRRSTGNPGGPGHVWVKKRYIDHGPWKIVKVKPQPVLRPDLSIEQVFIPALLEDNPSLMGTEYEAGLAASGGEKLFRAWRFGDWDALEGQYFEMFNRANHVVQERSLGIERWHERWISMDWGFNHPAALGLWAAVNRRYIKTLSLRVRGQSVPLLARLLEAEVRRRHESPEQYKHFFLSPECFGEERDEETIAQRFTRELRPMGFPEPEPAVNDRVNGWRAMADGLTHEYFLLTERNAPLVEFLETAVHDPEHPEDVLKVDAVDGVGGDDPGDETRYGIMSKFAKERKPYEERLREAIAERHTVRRTRPDPETGELETVEEEELLEERGEDGRRRLVMPSDPNVLAMRVRMAEAKMGRAAGRRGGRPKPRMV